MPRFFENDPQSIAEWITTLPEDDEFQGITSTFVSLWAELAPTEAAAWAAAEQPSALPAMVQTWLSKDET